MKHKNAAGNVAVPAQQIDLGECQIACADHQRYKKVSQHGGDGWNEKKEDHDDAVHGEQLVVGVGLYEIAGRRE